MKKIIKEILISQLSFPLKYKNEKEIWWEGRFGNPITIEIIDAENEQYVEREYCGNGQLLSKTNYHQGYLHGERLEWYIDGQLWYKENYHQGRLHGEHLQWYQYGQLWRKANYNHGKLINEEYY